MILFGMMLRKIKGKEINNGLTNYKHIKNLIITNEPMIKTTTAKVKRFEEMKKMSN